MRIKGKKGLEIIHSLKYLNFEKFSSIYTICSIAKASLLKRLRLFGSNLVHFTIGFLYHHISYLTKIQTSVEVWFALN